MGIFNKKLDYSSGNGILPKLKPENYFNLKLPNTLLLRMPDMNLMVKERDQGNLEKAFGASVEAFSDPVNNELCRSIIEKYLGALQHRMAPLIDDDATQMLAKLIGIGCGMAIVESKSGLMLSGKCHPSILNVVTRFTMNMGDEVKSHFKDVPVYQQLVEVAIEVGYVGTRMGGTPTPEEMLASVKAN